MEKQADGIREGEDEGAILRRMTEEERWNHLVALDDEIPKGGVILSEWCSLIVREADIAFVKGANLATILTAIAGIETHLRAELQTNGKVVEKRGQAELARV